MRIMLPQAVVPTQASEFLPAARYIDSDFINFVQMVNYADYLRQYLVQVRQELAARLIERLYADGTGKPSKWWMSFQKRRFMNRSLG